MGRAAAPAAAPAAGARSGRAGGGNEPASRRERPGARSKPRPATPSLGGLGRAVLCLPGIDFGTRLPVRSMPGITATESAPCAAGSIHVLDRRGTPMSRAMPGMHRCDPAKRGGAHHMPRRAPRSTRPHARRVACVERQVGCVERQAAVGRCRTGRVRRPRPSTTAHGQLSVVTARDPHHRRRPAPRGRAARVTGAGCIGLAAVTGPKRAAVSSRRPRSRPRRAVLRHRPKFAYGGAAPRRRRRAASRVTAPRSGPRPAVRRHPPTERLTAARPRAAHAAAAPARRRSQRVGVGTRSSSPARIPRCCVHGFIW